MNEGFTGGRVKIANEILAKVTREASMEITGVADVLAGYDFVAYDKFSTTDSAKGVKIATKDGQVRIDVRLIAAHPDELSEIGEKVQRNIVEKMEVITGLTVVEVNVSIESIAR